MLVIFDDRNKNCRIFKQLLSYVRNAAVNGIGTKIEGSIREITGKFEPSIAITDIKIKAQQTAGKRQIFYGEIRKDGYYEIQVPAGIYLITLELPSGFEFGQRNRRNDEPVKITSQKCEGVFFIFGNDSKVAGKAINANGNPIKDLKIELVSINTKNNENPIYGIDFTDEEGMFEFKYIPLGKYFLSLNYTNFSKNKSLFPVYFYLRSENIEQAEIIEISNGTKINNIVFQIPSKSELRTISGSVFDNKGNPIKDAQVFLRDEELEDWLNSSGIKTNVGGNFEIEAFDGRKYKIMVLAMRKNQIGVTSVKATTNVFTLDNNTQKFKIIVPISIKE